MSAEPRPESGPRRPVKSKSLVESFRYAFEGMNHVLRNQRHVRYQLIIFALVLVVALAVPVTAFEFAALILAMGLVLVAELVNTALEAVVDLITDRYEVLAKVAKDVAGAAVLVASITAAAAVSAVFLHNRNIQRLLSEHRGFSPHEPYIVLMAAGLLAILVVLGKIYGGRGRLLRGGVISGHSALAFLLFGSIFLLTHMEPVTSVVALLLALLVSQSRVDAGIHTVGEVVTGAVLAMLVIGVVFALQR